MSEIHTRTAAAERHSQPCGAGTGGADGGGRGMTEERCQCCDLPAFSCGKAIEQQERRERRLVHEYASIRARYAGKCAGCGDWFQVDDGIRLVAEGWIGECCA